MWSIWYGPYYMGHMIWKIIARQSWHVFLKLPSKKRLDKEQSSLMSYVFDQFQDHSIKWFLSFSREERSGYAESWFYIKVLINLNCWCATLWSKVFESLQNVLAKSFLRQGEKKITILIASHCSKVFEIFGDLNNTTTQCRVTFDIFEAEICKLETKYPTGNVTY